MLLVEIRPVNVGEPEFSICQLPQQEVAQAYFSAAAYQQIRSEKVCRIQKFVKEFFVNFFRFDSASATAAAIFRTARTISSRPRN